MEGLGGTFRHSPTILRAASAEKFDAVGIFTKTVRLLARYRAIRYRPIGGAVFLSTASRMIHMMHMHSVEPIEPDSKIAFTIRPQDSSMNTRLPYYVSFLLAGLLTLLTIVLQNYEFLLYAITVAILAFILYRTGRYFGFSQAGLWLFNVWLILHICGGLASYQGVRFYDLVLIDIVGEPYNILKYDQFVHFFCYLVMSILMWSVVQKIASKDASGAVVCVVTILAASSIGALNEIIEFLAVVALGTDGVGGYTNTAIDLVANLLGAIVGTLYMYATSIERISVD
jgi:uncharacterized membrane protein YjdF